MRIVDLDDAVTSATAVLLAALEHRNAISESCNDLAPEELCGFISDLCALSAAASEIAMLAANTLSED